MSPKFSLLLSVVLLSTAALGGPPPSTLPAAAISQPSSDWDLLVSLPIWAAGMKGDVGVAGFDPMPVDVKFKDIFRNLDMTAALTLEARHRRWGLILDGLYLKMSAGTGTPGRLLTSVDVEVEQVLAEAALTYRLLEGDRGYLDLIFGARYFYIQNEVTFHLDSSGVREVSEDLSNAITDRAVNVIQSRVSQAAARARAQLDALNLDERADALRSRLREGAIQKILQEDALIDIIKTIRDLTPAQRALITKKIEQSQGVFAANKALAQAVIQERVAAAVAAARAKAQQAVARARKKLAAAIESAIRETIPEHVTASKGWVDPFMGFRGRLNLTEKLYLTGRGDIGGFGVGSDLAWNVFGGVGMQLSTRWSTDLGWRQLAVDYQDGGFVFDTRMSGLFLGLTCHL